MMTLQAGCCCRRLAWFGDPETSLADEPARANASKSPRSLSVIGFVKGQEFNILRGVFLFPYKSEFRCFCLDEPVVQTVSYRDSAYNEARPEYASLLGSGRSSASDELRTPRNTTC
jgi:hypothetical protein